MTAEALTRAPGGHSGVRPIEPRRDMALVADLIETVFAAQLDAAGRRLVRDMRTFGRGGWLGWFLGRLVLPPAAYPRGFVWEEDGRVVGNASLLAVEGHPERWVLAHVAVHPEFRRRGIARALVQASVSWVRRHRGRTLLLQVRSSNEPAIALYAALGFDTLCVRTIWMRRHGPGPTQAPGPFPIRRRRPAEWTEQWELARRLHPEGLVWPYPPRAILFRPSGLAGLVPLAGGTHWVWHEAGRLVASLTVCSGSDRASWRLILVAEPGARGRVEGPLLAHAYAERNLGRRPATLEYPAGIAEKELGELGFRAERTLTWMEAAMREGGELDHG